MGHCAYFLNRPREKAFEITLDGVLDGFLKVLSGVNCAIPDRGVVCHGDYYVAAVTRSDSGSNINIYISAEEFCDEIGGEYWTGSIWIEDIYDCSALVLDIAREYLKAYPNDLFVYENNEYYFTKSDIDAICGEDFSEDWYYTYKGNIGVNS